MIVFKNGVFCRVEQDTSEADNIFLDRSWFVINTLLLAQESERTQVFDELIKYSRIIANIKYLKCLYPNDVIKAIADFVDYFV